MVFHILCASGNENWIRSDHSALADWPDVGGMEAIYLRLSRVLRDIGYVGGVSAACPWVSAEGRAPDLRAETARRLRYLRELRDRVY